MSDPKISRLQLLKILLWGSAGTVIGGLGISKFGNVPSALAQSNPPSSPNYSKFGFGNPKLTVIQDGTSYHAIRDNGSIIISGTDPTSIIQQGLNEGLTVGRTYKETVKLKGSFLNLRILLIPSFVVLDLSDAYLKQADTTKNHLLTNRYKKNGGNTKIDILGGIIDGNKTGNSADFNDLGFPGQDVRNTIHLENVNDCIINGVTLNNGYYHGLRIRNSSNILVSNCTFNSVSRESISISGQNQPIGTCRQMRITDNAIYNSGNSFITTLNASDILISGNLCETILGTTSGITINGLNNHVVNNTIRNSYKPLISISQLNIPDYDASGSIVHGNICQRTRSSHGITLTGYGCKDLSITNNIIVDAEEGIAISGNTHNILISNNIIRSCRKSGIRVNGVKGYNTKYIKISNNMCYNNGTRKDIREIHRAGIRLSADEVGTLHNCVIENNTCFDDRQLKKTQDFGIMLINTKDCVVKNNDTRNNIVAGISESGNTDMISSANLA